MKYVIQFSIILLVSFIGEVLHALLPLPVPASIYGLVLMLAALKFKVIKLHQIRETGKFLIDFMPLTFIPAIVGLINAWSVLKLHIVPVAVVTAVSTVLVMGISGLVTQAVIRKKNKKEGDWR